MSSEDHLLHDLARVRLVDAPAPSRERVRRILGTEPTVSDGDADIVVRWVERLRTDGPLRWIGRDRSAFDDSAFYVVDGAADGGRHLARLPLEHAGEAGLEIVCESGIVRPPALIELLNLRMLATGVLPIHGSAFRWRGIGVVAAGWSKGGKTETLLAFAADGADVVADEWSYTTPDRRVVGVAEPVRVERIHASQLGSSSRLPVAARRRIQLGRVGAVAVGSLRRGGSPGRRLANIVAPTVGRAQSVTLTPSALFGDRYVGRGALDHAVALFTTDLAAPEAKPSTPDRIADRMVFAHVHHRRDLVARYHELRFAFPDRCSALLERVEEVERELLRAALRGIPCTELLLPQLPTLDTVHDTLAPRLLAAP